MLLAVLLGSTSLFRGVVDGLADARPLPLLLNRFGRLFNVGIDASATEGVA